MAKTFRLPKWEPLLDIASYAREGPRAADRLTPAQIEHIRLTVNHAPEAVVKVLPRASNDLKAVGKHIDYIGRRGNLELEGDDGERLRGRVGSALLEDWDLDIDDARRQSDLAAATKRSPPKLVHKLMFSMPPGTQPKKVLGAVRSFAREEFYGKHRYAMVLHTDEPHPHVHLMVKAVSEQGERLNIRKATLREWRRGFARHLREQGVAANATERVVRGQTNTPKKDGIYRAMRRGESSHMRDRVRDAVSLGQIGYSGIRAGKSRLIASRLEVVNGWKSLEGVLMQDGHHELAARVSRFVRQMPPPQTEQEQTAHKISEQSGKRRDREVPIVR